MNTQIDWHQELDSSFGTGADRPPTDYLVPARAALRRRRTAMGAAALVCLVVVGGIGWAAAPGGESRAIDDQVATSSAPAPTSPDAAEDGPHVAIVREPDASLDQSWVELRGEVLSIAEDAEVGDWMANPMGYSLPANSMGVQVFRGEEERWMLLASGSDGPTWSTWEPPSKRFAQFHDWLAATVAFQKGLSEETPVVFQDGRLVPKPGFGILEQVIAPPEAAAYGPVADAAAVKYRTPEGETRFAIVHKAGDFTTVDPAVLEAPTMTAFLAHLQSQGDSGEGLR